MMTANKASRERKRPEEDVTAHFVRGSSGRLRSRLAPRRGIVLIAVLIVVVLLSLAAYQFSEMIIAEYRAADSTTRAAQSRALAISGVHFAAAILADKNSFTSRLNSNPYDNEG